MNLVNRSRHLKDDITVSAPVVIADRPTSSMNTVDSICYGLSRSDALLSMLFDSFRGESTAMVYGYMFFPPLVGSDGGTQKLKKLNHHVLVCQDHFGGCL